MIYTKRNGDSVEYFTEAEAQEKNLKVIPWRECMQKDQWLLTDDGYVIQSTRIKFISEKHGKKIRIRRKIWTGLAIRYPHGKRPLNLAEHIENRNYGLIPNPWYIDFDTAFPAIKRLLAKLVLTGKLRMTENRRYNRYEYEEMVKIAEKIFDNRNRSWYQIRTFFGREEVRDMIRSEIKKMAEEKGVTAEKVFDLLNEAVEFGKKKKDGKILIAVAKEYAAIVGMTGALRATGTKQLPPAEEGEELPSMDRQHEQILERAREREIKDTEYTEVPSERETVNGQTEEG